MIELTPIAPHQVEAANAVMDAVFQELWGLTLAFVRLHYDPFEDLLDPQAYYFENGGTFLVLTDEGRVVGTGGLGRVDAETAELKRVWLLKAYRGRGLGRRMVESLLEFARAHGYRRVELMVATPELQPEAVGLYRCLGFVNLPHTKESEEDTRIFMEKVLVEEIAAPVYSIRLEGQLAPHWSEWLEGMTITPLENGQTLLSGPLPDQAALHGLLAKIRDMNLNLIFVSKA